MSLSPLSVRMVVAGGIMLLGTLCLTLGVNMNYTMGVGLCLVGTYIVTLPLALLLTFGTCVSRWDTLATHAGMVGLTAPFQLVLYFFVNVVTVFA